MRKPSCMTNTLSAPGSSRLNYPDAQACPKLLLKNTYSLLSISPQSSGFRCLALAVRLSFWLETTETTLPCPLIPTVTPGPLSSPEICWTNSWGISKNSCTAHLSGGGEGRELWAQVSLDLILIPPSHCPARKKAIILDHSSLIVCSGAQHHLRVTHSLNWEQQDTTLLNAGFLQGTMGAESLCSSRPIIQCWAESKESLAFLLIYSLSKYVLSFIMA